MDVTLRGQVVHLVGPDLLDQAVEAAGVGHVAVMKREPGPPGVVGATVLKVIDAAPIHRGGSADDAVHLVALFEQELGQVRAVLSGNPCDERSSVHDLAV